MKEGAVLVYGHWHGTDFGCRMPADDSLSLAIDCIGKLCDTLAQRTPIS